MNIQTVIELFSAGLIFVAAYIAFIISKKRPSVAFSCIIISIATALIGIRRILAVYSTYQTADVSGIFSWFNTVLLVIIAVMFIWGFWLNYDESSKSK